jgi:hypothetical protein
MDFQLLEQFFQLTPQLKDLTLISDVGEEMVNGKRWKDFISSSLKHLVDFRFQFSVDRRYHDDDEIDSIPYLSNEYQISPLIENYHSQFIHSIAWLFL